MKREGISFFIEDSDFIGVLFSPFLNKYQTNYFHEL